VTEPLDVAGIAAHLRRFTAERDWEQYHTPKNLVMAMAGEAGELLDLFQWLTPEESVRVMDDPQKAALVRDEIADVLQYLVRLADILEVDLGDAVWSKLARNQERFRPGEPLR
jgi:NTP pyrophosphatase (non-canonical NTP hydrolase)